MKNAGWIIIYLIAGGVFFWTPRIIVNARRGYAFDEEDVGLITLLMPWTLLTFYAVIRWVRRKQIAGPSVASFMLVGVWMLGSLAMMWNATFTGGGFALPGRDVWIVIALGIFPPYTYIIATHDGSLGGLLLATALMCLMHFKYERKSRVIPPVVFGYFKNQLFPSL